MARDQLVFDFGGATNAAVSESSPTRPHPGRDTPTAKSEGTAGAEAFGEISEERAVSSESRGEFARDHGEVDSVERERLSAELERLTIRQVRETFGMYNGNLFGFALKTPAFEFTSARGFLGRWVPSSRTLQLDRRLLTEHSWGTLVEVLKHEMAHQYVDEVLGNPDGKAHGEVFRKVCSDRGIDAAARGVPNGAHRTSEETRVLERVSKLLALAESSNLHEAQAAMSAAQRLMLRHNIESATQAGAYGFRHLGAAKGRRSPAERILALILSEHFFVEVIWVPAWRPRDGKRGNVLEVCGTAPNLEIAAYVYDFLTHTAECLWTAHKRKQGLRKNATRQTYLYGVMCGFRDKLAEDGEKAKTEGLVWVGDAELERYYRSRHPYMRCTQIRTQGDGSAYSAGHAAGRKIVLHRGIRQGPSDGGPRLLRGG